jgi:hypothetical protein
MDDIWANEFREILPTLQARSDLRDRMTNLTTQNIIGRALEGSDRLDRFRTIMVDLVHLRRDLDGSIVEVSRQLPPSGSIYNGNRHVFNSEWERRIVMTTLSWLYSQAVLEYLRDAGQTTCFVPFSSDQDAMSLCSRLLAGHEHPVVELHEALVDFYVRAVKSDRLKIPEHPHCSHVVRPVMTAPG